MGRVSSVIIAIAGTILSAHNLLANDLYVGTQGGPWGKGAVYRYSSGNSWVNISQGTDIGQAIMDIKVFGGTLYVGTQTKSGYGGWGGAGQVWRYDGNTNWTKVGDELGTSCSALVIYENQLYAVASDMNARFNGMMGKLYRYDNLPGKWTLVGGHLYRDSQTGTYCFGFSKALVSNIRGFDEIYIGDLDKDSFYRYNKNEGLRLVDENWRSCVYSLTEYKKNLFSGCWHGAFYQSTNGSDFVMKTYLSNYNHIWATGVFKDNLFAGTGNGGYYSPGELRQWNGSYLHTIKSWPVTKYSEGVTTLATDENKLYIGLGIPTGYYSGDSYMAQVWSYDGTNFMKISDFDAFGGGVQSMLVAAPLKSTLELIKLDAKPLRVLEGGNVMVSATGAGSIVMTSENSIEMVLPTGWIMQPINAPSDGNGFFIAAVALPCTYKQGIYTVQVRLVGIGTEGSISSEWSSLSIEVVKERSMSSTELATYSILQDAILNIRAWDMNMEDAVVSSAIPKSLDLSACGIPLKEQLIQYSGVPKYSYRYWQKYSYTYNGKVYGPYVTERYYSFSSGNYSLALKNKLHSEYKTSTWSSIIDYETESRPYFCFTGVKPPEEFIKLKNVLIEFKTGYASSMEPFYLNLNDLFSSSIGSPSATFLDSGNGTIVPFAKVSGSTVQTFDLSTAILSSNTFYIGFDLLEESSPKIISSYKVLSYCMTSEQQYVYITYGVAPKLIINFYQGYSPQETLELMLASLLESDGSKAISIGQYVNDTYGKTPGEWGIDHCEKGKKGKETRNVVIPSKDYLVIGKDQLTLSGNSVVNGNAHSDNNLIFGGSAFVGGQADAINSIKINGNPTAQSVGYVTAKIFPSEQQVMSQVGSYYVSNGSIKISNKKDAQLYSGVIYVKGDLHISGDVTLNATFIVTGDIKVTGSTVLNGAGGGYALYTQAGSIDISGEVSIRGKVVGRTVSLGGKISVSK